MKDIIKYALKITWPIFLGYLVLGMAFGMMLQAAGYNALWAFFISIFVYAGSGQFLLVQLLASGADYVSVAVMTLLLNSRHIVYGLSFLDIFSQMKAYPYMIFSLTDETYAVQCSLDVKRCPYDIEKVRFYCSLFDHLYWIFGSLCGNLLLSIISFNTKGIEFTMTALFIVLFIELWEHNPMHLPALIGAGCAFVSLLIFGAANFTLPALVGIVILMLGFEKKIDKREEHL